MRIFDEFIGALAGCIRFSALALLLAAAGPGCRAVAESATTPPRPGSVAVHGSRPATAADQMPVAAIADPEPHWARNKILLPDNGANTKYAAVRSGDRVFVISRGKAKHQDRDYREYWLRKFNPRGSGTVTH